MGVTVVVIGLPNDVTISTIAQYFDTLFDTQEIGAFYLCDFRKAKYKWHKWQIALYFDSGYDASIAQSMLDGYNFIIDTVSYFLHARIRNDPNMLNNRLLNMVEVKMLRRSYVYEHNTNFSLVSELCTGESFEQYRNNVSRYYYYLRSNIYVQKHISHYTQRYRKNRLAKSKRKASNISTVMYNRRLKLSDVSIQNKMSSEPHTSINILSISNKEEIPTSQISREDSGIVRCGIREVDEVALIEDNTEQKFDPINQLNSVESSLELNSCHDEIDNNSFLDTEDKIWDAIDEVLEDIRTDIMFSGDGVLEKMCDSTK